MAAEATDGQKGLIGAVVAHKGGHASLERSDPTKAVAILEMLAEGATYREIRHRFPGLSLNTITQLKVRHEAPLDVRRKELASHAQEMLELNRQVSKMKYEQLANNPSMLEKVSVRDLAAAHGVYQDREMAARGENRTIIEVRNGRPSLADAQRVIEEARAKARAESVEIPATPVIPAKPVEEAKE